MPAVDGKPLTRPATEEAGMRRRTLLRGAGGAALAATTPIPVWADEIVDVDLRLVIAVDVSRSIDEDEARLQRQGYLEALADRRVIDAMTGGPLKRIAIAYVEWAGTHYQRTAIDWTMVDSAQAAAAFAAKLEASPMTSQSWTAVGAALAYAASKFDEPLFRSTRKVIDISGDGKTNNGPPAELVRDEVVKRGIVINGLPILSDRPNFGRPPEADLDTYYEEKVIGGPGSFMVVAKGFADFGRAIRNKMTKEIS
jgi:hypothetical protein